MKKNRDFSMHYAVLAGLGLFLSGGILLAAVIARIDFWGSKKLLPFPEGTRVLETDTRGGFWDNGIATITAYLPQDASVAYAQQLQEYYFAETPISEYAQMQLQRLSEAKAALKVTNGLWWFRDDSLSRSSTEACTDYTFELYDLDTCTYYYIEYDS